MNFSVKSYIKLFSWIVLILAAGYISLCVGGSILLRQSKSKIEEHLGSYFNQKVRFERAIYYFPRNIDMRKITFFSDRQDESPLLVSLEKAKISFSLLDSFRQAKIVPRAVILDKPVFQLNNCLIFVEQHRVKIIELIRSMSIDQDFFCSLKNSSVVSGENYISAVFDQELRIENRRWSAKGAVYFNNSETGAENFQGLHNAWRFIAKGLLSEDSLSIDAAGIVNNDFKLKLWGELNDEGLVLSGFSQLQNFLHFAEKSISEDKSVVENPAPALTRQVIYISDIDCRLSFAWPRVSVNNINFSIENMPFALSGFIVLGKTTEIDLKFSSFDKPENNQAQFNPRKFDVGLKGVSASKVFSGTLTANFYRKALQKYRQEQVVIALDSARVHAEKMRYLKFHLGSSDITYRSGQNVYPFKFADSHAFFDLSAERIKTFEFSSNIYDGFVSGRGTLDTAFMPPHSGIDFIIMDASPSYFESVVPFFSKISGKLRCFGYYRNEFGTDISGELVVEDGRLSDFQFFTWLSKSFKVAALADIDFHSIQSNFRISEEGARLSKISLFSDELGMEGDFYLAQTDFVAGVLALKIPRHVLIHSPQFRTLARMLGDDFYHLGFEFQLSGLFEEMNFRWLDSKFKQNLQKAIPGFIERGIERRVENAVQQFYKDNPR